MTVLMILTVTVIVTTVTVAISTARDLARLKTRLATLAERQDECQDQLAEATDYRKSIDSTRDMLRSILSARTVQQGELAQELAALEGELTAEPEISLSKPLDAASRDSFSD